LLILDALSVGITSQVAHSEDNMTWPLVTIPDFAAMGWTARQQMKAETLGLLPVVSGSDRESWEAYAVEKQDWVSVARKWEKAKEESVASASRARSLRGAHAEFPASRELAFENNTEGAVADFSHGISNKIFTFSHDGQALVDKGSGPFAPIWMTSPAPPKLTSINFNLLSHQVFWQAIESAIDSHDAVLSKALNLESKHETLTGSPTKYENDPISAFYYPVFDEISPNRTIVGLLATEVSWTHFFEKTLPSSVQGVVCVVENSCNQKFTYVIDGAEATFLGSGDLHDRSFDHLVETRGISYLVDVPENFAAVPLDFEHCPFELHVYPSGQLKKHYLSIGPILFASSMTALFLFAAAMIYVSRRREPFDDQSIVVLERNFHPTAEKQSLKSRALNILGPRKEGNVALQNDTLPKFRATLRSRSERMDTSEEEDDSLSNATVLFADITGFSKWSATKEPAEKEALFETILRSFSTVAERHGILQVQIVGHCFVAVAGKSESGNDHASTIIHFAGDCRNRMMELFKKMSAPELSMRFGIHSGYIQSDSKEDKTSKYQLFGDTIETTRQMLKKGKPNKVHVSVDTAELLNLAGKSNWISPRTSPVEIRGIGKIPTYWIKTKYFAFENSIDLLDSCDASIATESTLDEEDLWDEPFGNNAIDTKQNLESRFDSIVDRNVTMLLGYLKKIHAKRIVIQKFSQTNERTADSEMGIGGPIIEESREVVVMPAFEAMVAANMVNSDLIFISEQVESELRLYISSIASSYHANTFHNFEHATHVAVSLDKMLQKISMPSDTDKTYLGFNGKRTTAQELASELDLRSFGIASDPLTEFALMLSALVHDVDHVGVSNYQLVKEESPLAGLYKNQSVAEQNSVEIAWWLLMTPNFSALRDAIYSNAVEKRRLRQLLVNSVISTDILDRDLKVHRDRRWNKAFHKKTTSKLPEKVKIKDIQATVVIEHMMQAADSAHTMQNFRTYLKWNERLFEEMYQAYHDGRAEKDPSKSWYKGELAFFDKFVIPLAKRLRDSGVFGESANDYLKNAQENRKQWADRGQDIVHTMLEGFTRKVVATQEDTVVFS
jgi:class 3 adenylate cyclase